MNPNLSSTSRKTCGKELAHVMIRPEPGESYAGACRGRREVEAESVAYVVAAAHQLVVRRRIS